MARALARPSAANGATASARAADDDEAAARAVRARIAHAVLKQSPAAAGSDHHDALGAYTLRPAQREAVRRILDAIDEFGGALLADPPGTGKTIVALGVVEALRSPEALVVAPATLREQWLRSATRAGRRIRFISLEALSRGSSPPRSGFVIVDEAHHVRSPHTMRYRQLAELTTGTPVLLLTATPVVNHTRDCDALLALFLGQRAAALDADVRARVLIRRVDERRALPSIQWLPPLQTLDGPAGLGRALEALPPPLPARDGTQAAALIRMSLAMAWSSSLAALDAALRRRLQRGEALADALRQGRWPDRRALRDWILGDDATQLAMPLLVVPPAGTPPAEAHETLRRHLDAVRALRTMHAPAIADDTAQRARAIASLAAEHPERRLVAFAQHAETVQALFRALRPLGGVVAISANRVLAASGRWSREDVLRAFGPQAAPPSPRDARVIRLLLSTDLLAEGVDLQGAGIVVHLDATWTPARLEQRLGRAARIGGAGEVLVTRFARPRDAERLLQLGARLRRKQQRRQRAVAAAHHDEAWRRHLRRWENGSAARGVRVAAVQATRLGFLAVLRLPAGNQLVGAEYSGRRWRVVTAPDALAMLCRDADGYGTALPANAVLVARRSLTRWWRAQSARAALGTAVGDRPTARRLRRMLDGALREAPIASREAYAARVSTLLTRLRGTPGVGAWQDAQRALRAGLRGDALLRRLEQIPLARRAETARGAGPAPGRPRLVALLWLEAPA